MLPRFYLLLVDCADEAQLDLLCRQHEQHWLLRVGVDTLNREKALVG